MRGSDGRECSNWKSLGHVRILLLTITTHKYPRLGLIAYIKTYIIESVTSKGSKSRIKNRSVFDDLGFSPAEAAALQMKSVLHSQIVRYAKSYSQAQLQELLDETQPRISDLMRGRIAKFSLETLVTYAETLHMQPEIRTHQPARPSARVSA